MNINNIIPGGTGLPYVEYLTTEMGASAIDVTTNWGAHQLTPVTVNQHFGATSAELLFGITVTDRTELEIAISGLLAVFANNGNDTEVDLMNERGICLVGRMTDAEITRRNRLQAEVKITFECRKLLPRVEIPEYEGSTAFAPFETFTRQGNADVPVIFEFDAVAERSGYRMLTLYKNGSLDHQIRWRLRDLTEEEGMYPIGHYVLNGETGEFYCETSNGNVDLSQYLEVQAYEYGRMSRITRLPYIPYETATFVAYRGHQNEMVDVTMSYRGRYI